MEVEEAIPRMRISVKRLQLIIISHNHAKALGCINPEMYTHVNYRVIVSYSFKFLMFPVAGLERPAALYQTKFIYKMKCIYNITCFNRINRMKRRQQLVN